MLAPELQQIEIIDLDALDRADLHVTPAIQALGTLEYILSAMPDEYTVTGREIASLLRCINITAARGWPMGALANA